MSEPRVYAFDPLRPDLGWRPAVPLPYSHRPWWRLFRLTLSCYPSCGLAFPNRTAYEDHWRDHHG